MRDLEQRLILPAKKIGLHRLGACKNFLKEKGVPEVLCRVRDNLRADTNYRSIDGPAYSMKNCKEYYDLARKTVAPELESIPVIDRSSRFGKKFALSRAVKVASVGLGVNVLTALSLGEIEFQGLVGYVETSTEYIMAVLGSTVIAYSSLRYFEKPSGLYNQALNILPPSIELNGLTDKEVPSVILHEMTHQWADQIAGESNWRASPSFHEGWATVAALEILRDHPSLCDSAAYSYVKYETMHLLSVAQTWLSDLQTESKTRSPDRYVLGTAALMVFDELYNNR